jgi:ABC-type multidrug transport system ATPase subunit
MVRLDDLADKPARVFSRGQKQRLGLARALVHEPSVLLLDEPASGLDPQSRVDLRVTLKRLAQEGRTILISSHVLSELDELADDAVFLQSGRTVSGERLAQAQTALRDWRLRALDQPQQTGTDAATAVLRGLGFPESLIRRERDALLVAFASERDAAGALSNLVAAGVLVAEFAPATGRLEQTFLDLNGGDQ